MTHVENKLFSLLFSIFWIFLHSHDLVEARRHNGVDPEGSQSLYRRIRSTEFEQDDGNSSLKNVNEHDFLPLVSETMRNHQKLWLKIIGQSDYVKGYNTTSSHDQRLDVDYEEEDGQNRGLAQLVFQREEATTTEPKQVTSDCECGLYNPPSQRIVNGEETAANEFPWMVSLQLRKGDFPYCGASIISNWYVLTAAHCTDGWAPRDIQVRIADHDLTTKDVPRERSIMVDEIKQHEEYTSYNTNNDIALLRLAKELRFTWRVNPVCLTPYDLTYYREKVKVIGWGKEDSEDNLGSPVLRHTDVEFLPMGKCRRNFAFHRDQITSKMTCAIGDDTDACQGDSGGPAVWLDPNHDKYLLVGLTSWGVGCNEPDYPGVYTKVIKFVSWIYDNTQDSVFCSSVKPEANRVKDVEKSKLNKHEISPGKGKGKKKDKKKNKKKNKGKKGKKKTDGKTKPVKKKKKTSDKARKQRQQKRKMKRKHKKKERRKMKRKEKRKNERRKLRKKISKRIRKKLKASEIS